MAPGFFGKVSSHGDFVGRRLPTVFTQGWDEWLQRAQQASLAALGDAWLTTYLTSPIWRFAISAGILGEQAWAGIVMPSVDRVGRHFPLTVAVAIDGAADLLALRDKHAPWFENLETLALTSLENGFVLDDFDAALQAVPGLPSSPVCGTHAPMYFSAADAAPATVVSRLLCAHSVWWTEGSPKVDPCLLISEGLPLAKHAVALLDGSWGEAGWQLPDLGISLSLPSI